MEYGYFVLIYLIIFLIVAVLTFLAIKFLPKIDKSFNLEESLLGNMDCYLEDAVSELKLVNQMER